MVRISATSRHSRPARAPARCSRRSRRGRASPPGSSASRRALSASRSIAPPSARSSSMSWNQTSAAPASPARSGRCARRRRWKPMFSSTGTRSESGIGFSRLHTFRPAARAIAFAAAVEVDAERPDRREAFDEPDVGDGDRRRDRLRDSRPETRRDSGGSALRLDRLVDQRRAPRRGRRSRCARAPRPRCSSVARSGFGVSPPSRAMMKCTRTSGPSGKERIEGRTRGPCRRRRDSRRSRRVRRVVALARHEDEDRHEAVEAIVARQHAHARALVEVQDGERELVERVLVDLEQLVARIAFQHRRQRLAGMAVGIEAGAAHQVVDLAPQIGDRAGRARVGRGGEQADDAELADEVARRGRSASRRCSPGGRGDARASARSPW